MQDSASSAGLVASTVSLTVALFVMLLLSPPWGAGAVVLGVGLSSYFSGYFVAAAS